MAYYSRSHYRSVSPRADTKAEIDARLIDNLARVITAAEREEQFPRITAENSDEACRWQNERIVYHRERLIAAQTNK